MEAAMDEEEEVEEEVEEESEEFLREAPWTVIESYFRGQHLERFVRHQLESYNNFVNYQIIRTIEMFNPVRIVHNKYYNVACRKYALEVFVTFSDFQIYRPQIHENNGAVKLMFPQEARLRNFTYAAATMINVNVKYVVRSGDDLEQTQTYHKTFPNVHIGKLPIMLRSSICVLNQYKHFEHSQTGECKHDPGGYFIINGSEKIILAQERPGENRVNCFNVSKNDTKYSWRAEIKSVPDYKCISPKQINMMLSSKNNGFGFPILFELPRIKHPIPLFIMFRALGVMSDKEICRMILLDVEHEKEQPLLAALEASIVEASRCLTQEEAIRFIMGHLAFSQADSAEKPSTAAAVAAASATSTHSISTSGSGSGTASAAGSATATSALNTFPPGGRRVGRPTPAKDDEDEEFDPSVPLAQQTSRALPHHAETAIDQLLSRGKVSKPRTDAYVSTTTTIHPLSSPAPALGKGVGEPEKEKDKDKEKEKEKDRCRDREVESKKRYDYAIDLLNFDLFPHCQSREQKLYFLGYMARKLLLASFQLAAQDDRDACMNKRLDLAGPLLNNLYRNHFNKLVKDMEKNIKREIDRGSWRTNDDYENIITLTNINKIVKSITIENAIKRALSTGDFGIKHSAVSNKVGVAQVLNRLNYLSTLSHLRRVSTPTDKSGKLIPPRKLHNTSWGYLCPAETPEGQSVGVVKNLSYMTHVTIHSSSVSLHEYVLPMVVAVGSERWRQIRLHNQVKVFVNGAWVGIAEQPLECYQRLKAMKMRGILNVYTSIVFDYRWMEIRVCNDAGRLTRPLLRVDPATGTIPWSADLIARLDRGECTWDELVTSSSTVDEPIIEYVDSEEQAFAMVAVSPRELVRVNRGEGGGKGGAFAAAATNRKWYTHCEIHPSTILGVLASCIPFPEHNQSPRNTYQCAQGKQAMGVYATNYHLRMDKTAYVLNYPMRPLVDTRIMNIMQLHSIPCGSQLIVAIMSHTGYNQEDSLLVNQGSIDRGMALVTVYHTEKDEDKQKINGDEEIRCKPDKLKTKGMNLGANYDKVNHRGEIPENRLVENRDIIIAKVSPIKENRNDPTKLLKYEDQSKMFKTSEETYIDRNCMDRNGDGYTFAKVKTRAVRRPVIGDKFSSRHGQKGTVGRAVRSEDMPFTASGIQPDIILNPHAIPSRMTIGHLKETLLGKLLLELGMFGDGTAFGELDVRTICAELARLGFEATGEELVYDPETGEQHACSVFIGTVFYQRLKHMVNDKVHSRSVGQNVILTRQPTEGRSREGGLRFGEMERDCMVAHGAAAFVVDRMYYASDKYMIHVCKRCGQIASFNDNPQFRVHKCHFCDNTTDFSFVRLAYACKLLMQELQVMNIASRLITSDP